MKTLRLIAFAAMCMAGSYASAQDLIVKKDGSVIQAKVTKIGTSEVEYKKWSNQDGPQYSIAVADILAINYQNGEKETFENVSASGKSKTAKSEADGQQSIVQVKPEDLSPEAKAANDALIAKYNQAYDTNIGTYKKNSNAKSAYLRLGISSESVLENDDISISMETGFLWKDKKDAPWQLSYHTIWNNLSNVGIRFKISNKTDNTLYLDLGNTFYVSMGQSYVYYLPSATTNTSSSSSGIGVNAGSVTNALGIGGLAGSIANGITVGGGKTSGTSVTTYSQRFVAVPPRSTYHLEPQFIFGDEDKEICAGLSCSLKSSTNSYTRCCIMNFSSQDANGGMKEFDMYSYSEQSSPLKMSFVTKYSKSEDFITSTSIHAGLFLKEVYGDELYSKMFKSSKFPLKKTRGSVSGQGGAGSAFLKAMEASQSIRPEEYVLLFKVKVSDDRNSPSFPKF